MDTDIADEKMASSRARTIKNVVVYDANWAYESFQSFYLDKASRQADGLQPFGFAQDILRIRHRLPCRRKLPGGEKSSARNRIMNVRE